MSPSSHKTLGAALFQAKLKERNLNYAAAAKELTAAARKIGQTVTVSRASVWQWATNKNIPSRQPSVVIAFWTDNEIPVNAWDAAA